ncbi:MAG TPA: sugar phosphate nucleotidyltransferase [Candidatus Hodarchaeales archaeon]|nr:sugar phosphate nucleotidyltransferase [Candidatus Hodarchaeales archaeon]
MKSRGTAKMLQLVQGRVRSDFLILPCDTYFDFDVLSLVKFHRQYRAIATFAINTRTSFDSKYKGVVEMDGVRIVSHVERPVSPTSHLIKTMIGIINPEVFDYIPNGDVRYSIEEQLISQLISERRCFGYPVAGEWFNIHDQNDLNQLEEHLRKAGSTNDAPAR